MTFTLTLDHIICHAVHIHAWEVTTVSFLKQIISFAMWNILKFLNKNIFLDLLMILCAICVSISGCGYCSCKEIVSSKNH